MMRMEAMSPFSTPESRAALESLKDIVRANTSLGMIEAHAFRLIGEPQAVIDDEAHGLYEALRQRSPPLSHTEAFAFALALRELIRHRPDCCSPLRPPPDPAPA